MTERERLIELTCKANDKYPTIPLVNGCRESFMDFLSDYLLANGVIVPPCKVGDTVYFLCADELCEATVTLIEANCYTDPRIWLTVRYDSKIVGTHYYKSRIDLMLGKSVFLSREEAEKALEERSKG